MEADGEMAKVINETREKVLSNAAALPGPCIAEAKRCEVELSKSVLALTEKDLKHALSKDRIPKSISNKLQTLVLPKEEGDGEETHYLFADPASGPGRQAKLKVVVSCAMEAETLPKDSIYWSGQAAATFESLVQKMRGTCNSKSLVIKDLPVLEKWLADTTAPDEEEEDEEGVPQQISSLAGAAAVLYGSSSQATGLPTLGKAMASLKRGTSSNFTTPPSKQSRESPSECDRQTHISGNGVPPGELAEVEGSLCETTGDCEEGCLEPWTTTDCTQTHDFNFVSGSVSLVMQMDMWPPIAITGDKLIEKWTKTKISMSKILDGSQDGRSITGLGALIERLSEQAGQRATCAVLKTFHNACLALMKFQKTKLEKVTEEQFQDVLGLIISHQVEVPLQLCNDLLYKKALQLLEAEKYSDLFSCLNPFTADAKFDLRNPCLAGLQVDINKKYSTYRATVISKLLVDVLMKGHAGQMIVKGLCAVALSVLNAVDLLWLEKQGAIFHQEQMTIWGSLECLLQSDFDLTHSDMGSPSVSRPQPTNKAIATKWHLVVNVPTRKMLWHCHHQQRRPRVQH
eukprot:682729-Amphidinium_carterae.1